MKILVIGTAGFIGHALTKKLLARGDEAVELSNISGCNDVTIERSDI